MKLVLSLALLSLAFAGCDDASDGPRSTPAGAYALDRSFLELRLLEREERRIAERKESLPTLPPDEAEDEEIEIASHEAGYREWCRTVAESTEERLVLRPDRTFAQTGHNPGGTLEATGTWEVDGDLITLTTVVRNGEALEPPLDAVGEWDATSLTLRPRAEVDVQVRYVRQ